MLAPQHFLLFGGGWHNPLILEDFKRLLSGDAGVLPEHEQIFRRVANPQAEVVWSDAYGLNSQYMEARIFADMAKCKITGEPFSFPPEPPVAAVPPSEASLPAPAKTTGTLVPRSQRLAASKQKAL